MRINKCEICAHPARAAIEKMLRKGGNTQFIADRYGVTDDVMGNHRDQHMGALVPEAEADGKTAILKRKMDPEVVFEEHNECIRYARMLIDYSMGERDKDGVWQRFPDPRGWALGMREWRGCLDQQNRILGLYDHVDPRLQRSFAARIIQVVSQALEKFPDAKDRVLAVIDEVEKDSG